MTGQEPINMWRDFSVQSGLMGVLAAFVGFAGSFAVTLQGLISVGASHQQAASGLMALACSMGLCGIVLSVKTRLPVSVAWSTPGAALLATTGIIDGGFPVAVGAFIVCGVLLTLSGLWKPLGNAVARIPVSLASAMLAGILFYFCLAPVRAVVDYPAAGLLIVVSWALVGRVNKLAAVPAALAAFVLYVAFNVDLPHDISTSLRDNIFVSPVWVTPQFTVQGLIGIALPLFIVTTASQNIPGMAVLRVNKYNPEAGLLFSTTGFFSVLSAPFGGHAINLAAITAALCAGDEAHSDPDRRYWAAIVAGICYLILGVLAGLVTLFVTLAPQVLVQAVAGLALIAAFTGSITAAFQDTQSREAAAVTFFVTASGLTIAGVSSAFWGLIAGGLCYLLSNVPGKK